MLEKFSEQLHQLASVDEKRSGSLCSRLSDEFQRELLDYDSMPESFFNYFLTLISVEQYYQKPGVWQFILALNTPRDDLSEAQFKQVAGTFVDNFEKYNDGDLCLAVCDFIARNMEPIEATSLLNQLKAKEVTKGEKLRGYADEGLHIVQQEVKRAKLNPK